VDRDEDEFGRDEETNISPFAKKSVSIEKKQ